MNDEFKTFAPAPELTLEPFKEEMQTPVPAPEKQEIMDESILTDDERRTVDQFASQIDLTNSTMILQYGAGTQKKMADFSETAMENVKTKDLGEVGDLLSGVVKELRNFDEEEEKGFLGIFKKTSNKIQSMKAKYAKAETNINEICKVLENHQVLLLKDIAILDKMYELNLTYFKELTMYILAGKKKLQEVRSTKLQELVQKAATMPSDVQWHFIGHLQTNKVKTVVPIVTLIHSVDSGKLLTAINAEAEKIGKIVDVLLELHVAQEETKYGFDLSDLVCLEKTGMLDNCRNVRVRGVMGMATNTDNETEIRKEFQRIVGVFREMKSGIMAKNPVFDIVSMGMSDDYRIAVEEGSTMIRVGSHIFGPRQY